MKKFAAIILSLTLLAMAGCGKTDGGTVSTDGSTSMEKVIGAFGLGAGKWRVIYTVVLPGCVDGVVTGCILSVGRILGESAALPDVESLPFLKH